MVCDAHWQVVEKIAMPEGPIMLPEGNNTVLFDARFTNADAGVEPFAQVEIRVLDVAKRL